jgi:hypothetical protein
MVRALDTHSEDCDILMFDEIRLKLRLELF